MASEVHIQPAMMNARATSFRLPLLLGAYLAVSAVTLLGSPLSMGMLPQNTSSIDWSGVALLSVNGNPNCSAIAIAPNALITAAHCVAPGGAASVSQNVTALLRSMTDVVQVTSAAVIPYPTYQASYLGGDVAVVMLNEVLPAWVAVYGIYALGDELGQVFHAAGFAGADFGGFHDYQNRFENSGLFWASDWLSFDYDSGLEANNALAAFGYSDLGVASEGMIRLGDSGGPAFINGMVAGIPSGIWRYQYLQDGVWTSADVDSVINSTMGEIGFMVRASLYRDWILATVAANTFGTIGQNSTAVPEPGTLPLVAAALAVFWRAAKNRRS
jgi:Trypsin/PEP-CTERM motif